MSDVLNGMFAHLRFRVKETHGIRRFLYPLSIPLDFPTSAMDMSPFNLMSTAGEVMPTQWQNQSDGYEWLLEFAVSLAPFEEREFVLTSHESAVSLDDPLQVTMPQAGSALKSVQKRLQMEIGRDAWIRQVEYDGISHLRQSQSILRNGESITEQEYPEQKQGDALAAWVQVSGKYPDGCHASTDVEITACKSWISLTHGLEYPKPEDKVTFYLPFAVTTAILTCDFGVGGGTFGKLLAETAEEVIWRTEFGEAPYARWSLATAGRVDYIGEVATAEEFLPQRWFHLIDRDKALAVAITDLPKSCREMTVSLNIQGDVVINFRLGEQVPEAVTFGVCYHFLNDIPSIAAATNPQSILLPPTVEVLPT